MPEGIRVVQVDKVTRDVVATFDSERDAAIANGLSTTMVSRCVRKQRLGVLDTYFRNAETFDRDEVFTSKYGLPVAILENRVLYVYPNVGKLADDRSLTYAAVHKWLKKGKVPGGGIIWKMRFPKWEVERRIKGL